jgi:hypothetical protein
VCVCVCVVKNEQQQRWMMYGMWHKKHSIYIEHINHK